MPDVASGFAFLLDSDIHGPVNLCAPGQADLNTLVRQLGHALHRPAVARVPAFVLKLLMDGLASELLLASQRMEPGVLASAGFQWQHGTVEAATEWVAAGVRKK